VRTRSGLVEGGEKKGGNPGRVNIRGKTIVNEPLTVTVGGGWCTKKKGSFKRTVRGVHGLGC